ncbi:hypothetical protein DC522_03560 [Microvirga sp. KLBC 81]|uniref:hypothetical protein n=1 Tax=Microvirga sp. KLBC 81 TaxID=1862707 RepID=UPI000D51A040|nr:hypothetical protein [Microvirga sp. KLBC 81]PVE25858.1 hypothetical protein DC522_03560 [Microvirga sp. KLBC 81]
MNRLLPTLLLGTIAAGLSACVTTSDRREDLKVVFHDQIKACYRLPKEAAGAEPVIVEVRLKSNGALERQPEIIRGSPNSFAAKGALRALDECAPFRIPTEWASRHGEWKVMHIQFDTTR